MSTHPHTGKTPKVTGEGADGNTRRLTIPKGLARELGIQPGDQPRDIEYDEDGRIIFDFSDE